MERERNGDRQTGQVKISERKMADASLEPIMQGEYSSCSAGVELACLPPS